MKGRGDRSVRVAARIREEVSLILQHRAKDPGLGGITVTDVTVTGDLKIARIHYSVHGGDEERIAARDGLRRSRGYIRKELSRVLQMRYSPDVTFHYDASFEKGARIDILLRKAAEEISREE
ncbi:MAG: 30S ribosome-binding factor RbfA [Thermodesulfobacteriota bacterium]|nr:30S ribosome-binding factor RbfA [Thermodesulfobacteriota bacterium]